MDNSFVNTLGQARELSRRYPGRAVRIYATTYNSFIIRFDINPIEDLEGNPVSLIVTYNNGEVVDV